jgi:hypothetical protein
MQRWIVLAVVAMMLVLGGGGYAYWTYKQNRPHPMWVPLPINPQLPDAKREELARELKAKLGTTVILTQVSKDLGLAKRWELASDSAAAAEVGRRLFVKVGEADTPMGRVPSLNIGVEGPNKDVKLTGEIAMRLMEDVRKILGVKPPPPPEKF